MLISSVWFRSENTTASIKTDTSNMAELYFPRRKHVQRRIHTLCLLGCHDREWRSKRSEYCHHQNDIEEQSNLRWRNEASLESFGQNCNGTKPPAMTRFDTTVADIGISSAAVIQVLAFKHWEKIDPFPVDSLEELQVLCPTIACWICSLLVSYSHAFKINSPQIVNEDFCAR